MKKQMLLLVAGSMPLVVAANTVGESIAAVDVGTLAGAVLGCVALVLARRMQRH